MASYDRDDTSFQNITVFFRSGRKAALVCSTLEARRDDGLVMATTQEGFVLLQTDEIAAIIPTEYLAPATESDLEGGLIGEIPVSLLRILDSYPRHLMLLSRAASYSDKYYYKFGAISQETEDALQEYRARRTEKAQKS